MDQAATFSVSNIHHQPALELLESHRILHCHLFQCQHVLSGKDELRWDGTALTQGLVTHFTKHTEFQIPPILGMDMTCSMTGDRESEHLRCSCSHETHDHTTSKLCHFTLRLCQNRCHTTLTKETGQGSESGCELHRGLSLSNMVYMKQM